MRRWPVHSSGTSSDWPPVWSSPHETTDSARSKAKRQPWLRLRPIERRWDGKRQIRSDPPLIVRLDDMKDLDPEMMRGRLGTLMQTYRKTLPSDRQHLLDHFTITDIGHKVVGVGSVGTRAWILLLEAGIDKEVLVMQAKQAGPSALSGFAGESQYHNDGQTCGRRSAPHAGIERHLSGLVSRSADGCSIPGLLRTAAT
jgi:uncharacterized protein DUF2252